MAINQRLVKRFPEHKYRDGYPDILFEGFRLRFGQVYACFTNANMQSIAGLADPKIQRVHLSGGPVPTAAWLFYTFRAMEAEIARRKGLNLPTAMLEELLEKWPHDGVIPRGLKNLIGYEE